VRREIQIAIETEKPMDGTLEEFAPQHVILLSDQRKQIAESTGSKSPTFLRLVLEVAQFCFKTKYNAHVVIPGLLKSKGVSELLERVLRLFENGSRAPNEEQMKAAARHCVDPEVG